MWILRDLGSRNGTLVDGHKMSGDWELEDGQTIQLGACEIVFTYELANSALPEDDDEHELESPTETRDNIPVTSRRVSDPEIVSRKKRTRYSPASTAESIGRDRFSQDLAQLWKLAVEMGAAKKRETTC